MQYDLELEFFDGPAFKSARRDVPITGTIRDAVRTAEKLFADSAQGPVIPFVCRVVERDTDTGQLVAVVGADRETREVLTVMQEQYRLMQ
jgi:hypothetical protein